MYKKLLLTIAAALCTLSLFAQTGGIKGQVVNRIGRTPVPGAVITVSGMVTKWQELRRVS